MNQLTSLDDSILVAKSKYTLTHYSFRPLPRQDHPPLSMIFVVLISSAKFVSHEIRSSSSPSPCSVLSLISALLLTSLALVHCIELATPLTTQSQHSDPLGEVD
jgi:hypothetical protein